MKTVIIHGQNHHGSSYHTGRILAEKIATEEEITEFFLPRDLNHFCTGCCKCLGAEENCPFYTEKKVILDAIEDSEVVVFTTPTYCLRASAPMKSFIDLTFINWMPHRPKEDMFGKKAVVISTAAGSGTKTAIKDVKTCLNYWGISYVKTLGFSVSAMNWEGVPDKTKKKIEEKAAKLGEKVVKDKVRVRFKIKFLFNLMKKMVNNPENINTPLKSDYIYWQEKGWLQRKKPY